MQAKGLIKFFVIAFVVVCIYQLSFTYIAANIESKSASYAERKTGINPDQLKSLEPFAKKDSVQRLQNRFQRRFLDSMSSETVLNLGIVDFNYNDIKQNQINLGLDLKGGMSLVLEVAVDNVIKGLSFNSQDEHFNEAIRLAKEKQKESGKDFLTLFQESYEEISPNGQLANIFAPLQEFSEEITYSTSNKEVIGVLRRKVDESVQNTYNVIKTRIDQFGVAQPNINFQQSTGRIYVELPGVDDPSRVRKLLQQTAKLEFWHTYDNQEIVNYFLEANDVLRNIVSLQDTSEIEEDSEPSLISSEESQITSLEGRDTLNVTGEPVKDTSNALLTALDDTSEISDTAAAGEIGEERNPLFEVLQINIDQSGNVMEGPMIGFTLGRDTSKINDYLDYPQIRSVFPRDLMLLWSAKAFYFDSDSRAFYGLYAIKKDAGTSNKAPLTGEVITNARQAFDQFGQPSVSLSMNSIGASKWETMTRKAYEDPLGPKCIAIVLDQMVFSAPVVQSVIKGGQSEISGLDDVNEAVDLANILRAGRLEAPAKIIEESVVGPSLGQSSVNSGLLSLLIGLSIVLLFMVFYYSNSGFVSNLALLLNLFLIIGALASLNAALTLPGMAGIVLTIGMAVDANVIIFERIREELNKGKGARLALVDGFKHSYSAIIDANLTTLITAIILLGFGLGPVKGFAIVLLIGIISSFFTAVIFSRLVFDYYLSKDKKIKFSTGLTQGAFKNINFDFLSKRKVAYIGSLLFILIGIGSMFTQGFNFGVDFKGGRRYVISFNQQVEADAIKQKLAGVFGSNPQVTTYGTGSSEMQITTDYRVDDEDENLDAQVQQTLYEGLTSFYDPAPGYESFVSENIKRSAMVESSIADDIRQSAIWVILIGSLAIFLYILIRFRKWQFGVGALIAIVHDVAVILTLFTLLKNVMPFALEIDQAFIAALLTIIGYSINDTVVVFDRIREYLKLHPTTKLMVNVNHAIQTTLSRTLITSLTTLMVVVILFIFGGEAIRSFSFALVIGILVGTYSSVFIASPIAVDLLRRSGETTVKYR